jgi:hypothetical protein
MNIFTLAAQLMFDIVLGAIGLVLGVFEKFARR